MLNYKIAEWLNTTGSFACSFVKLLIFRRLVLLPKNSVISMYYAPFLAHNCAD